MKYQIPPWPHQLEAIELAKDRDFFALFFEMGCGKTAAAINIMRWKMAQERRILSTLILCPVIVVENWRREIAANAGQMVIDATQALSGRDKKAKQKQLAKEGKHIFITNIETVTTDLWNDIKRRRWDMLLVDESHRFKSNEAKRTKRLIKFADCVRYKFILSGSPILNSEMDIWAQYRILDRSIFEENFTAFRAEWFVDKNAGMPSEKHFPNWQPRESTKEKLKEVIAHHSMRVEKEEVLKNLPPLVKQSVFVELTPEQRKHYKEMEKHFITYINDDACVAELALTKILRLQQIVAGIVKVAEKEEPIRIESAKLMAVKELLGDLCPKHKVIIWSCFVDTYGDLMKLCDEMKLSYRIIRGGQGREERQRYVDEFNNDPSVNVMIANQRAGGTGVGLQAAPYAIYYARNYNLEEDIQSESRNHRGGSEHHKQITRIDIIAQDTLDDDITDALRNKTELGDFLLSLRRKYNER